MNHSGDVYISTLDQGDRARTLEDGTKEYIYTLRFFGRLYPTKESVCIRVEGHRPFIYLGTTHGMPDPEDRLFVYNTFDCLLQNHTTLRSWKGRIHPEVHHLPYRGFRRDHEATYFWKIDFPTKKHLDMFVKGFWYQTLMKESANRTEVGTTSFRIDPDLLAREVGKAGLVNGFRRWSTSSSLRSVPLSMFSGGYSGGSIEQYSLACIEHNLPTAGWIHFARGREDKSYHRQTKCKREFVVSIDHMSECLNPPAKALEFVIGVVDLEVFPRHSSFPAPTRNWRFGEQPAQQFIHRWRKYMESVIPAFHEAHPDYPKRSFHHAPINNLFANTKQKVNTQLISREKIREILEEVVAEFQWESAPSLEGLLDVTIQPQWETECDELDANSETFQPDAALLGGCPEGEEEEPEDVEDGEEAPTTEEDCSDEEDVERVRRRKRSAGSRLQAPPSKKPQSNRWLSFEALLTDYHSPWYHGPSTTQQLLWGKAVTAEAQSNPWSDSRIFQCLAFHWWIHDMGKIRADPISYINVTVGNHLSGEPERDICFSWNVGEKPNTKGVDVRDCPEIEMVVCGGERDMLVQFAETIAQLDLDIVAGHNIFNFDNSYLSARARLLGVERKLLEAFTKQRWLPPDAHMNCKQTFVKGLNVSVELFPGVGMLQIDTLIWARKNRGYPTNTLEYVSQVNLGDKLRDVQVDGDCLKVKTGSLDILKEQDYVTLLVKKFVIEPYSSKWQVMRKTAKEMWIRPTEVEPASLPAMVADMKQRELHQSSFTWGLVKDDMPIAQMRAFTVSTNAKERGLVAKYCAQDCHLPLRLLFRLGIVFEFIENAIINTASVEDVMSRGQNARLTSCCTKYAFQQRVPVQFEECRRPMRDKSARGGGKKFEGGQVLTPDPGLWNDCGTMDFNSLYPSLQSENELDGKRFIYAETLLFANPETARQATASQLALLEAINATNGDPSLVSALMDSWLPPAEGVISPEQRGFYTVSEEVHYNQALWQEFKATEPTGYFADEKTRPRWCPHAWRATNRESIRCVERTFTTTEKDPKKRRVLGVIRVYSVSVTHRYHPSVNAVMASIIPALGAYFMKMRKDVKKKQKKVPGGSTDFMILEGKQLGYKLNANALYGLSGDVNSKFHDREHAPCTTAAGRKSILFTADMARRLSKVHAHIGFPTQRPDETVSCVECGVAGGFGGCCSNKDTPHCCAEVTTPTCGVCAEKWSIKPNWVVCAQGHMTHAHHLEGEKGIRRCRECHEPLLPNQRRRPLRVEWLYLDDRPVEQASVDDWTDADWLVGQYESCLRNSPFEHMAWQQSLRYRRGLQLLEQTNGFIQFQQTYMKAERVEVEGRPMRKLPWEQAFQCTEDGKWVYAMPCPATDVDEDLSSPYLFPIDECRDIYGDTDSVFMKTTMHALPQLFPDSPDTQTRIICATSLWLASRISRMFGAPMNLEFEKHEKRLLLVSKKRYFSMIVKPDALEEEELLCQGLQIKKRDTAEALRNVQGLLNESMVLEDMPIQEALAYIQSFKEKLESGEIGLAQLVIPKPLRDTYKKPESISQWVLANRIGREDPGRQPKPGETMQVVHVIPKGAETWTLKELEDRIGCGYRIELVDMVSEKGLQPNYRYYLVKQLYKPLCSNTFSVIDPEGFFRFFKQDALWEHHLQPKLKAMQKTKYGLDGMRDNDYVSARIKLLSETMMQVMMGTPVKFAAPAKEKTATLSSFLQPVTPAELQEGASKKPRVSPSDAPPLPIPTVSQKPPTSQSRKRKASDALFASPWGVTTPGLVSSVAPPKKARGESSSSKDSKKRSRDEEGSLPTTMCSTSTKTAKCARKSPN